jgi:hypothetical protein
MPHDLVISQPCLGISTIISPQQNQVTATSRTVRVALAEIRVVDGRSCAAEGCRGLVVKASCWQSFDCQFDPYNVYLSALMAAPLWCGLGCISRTDGHRFRFFFCCRRFFFKLRTRRLTPALRMSTIFSFNNYPRFSRTSLFTEPKSLSPRAVYPTSYTIYPSPTLQTLSLLLIVDTT